MMEVMITQMINMKLKETTMFNIEFEINHPEQWLLGLYYMKGEAEHMETGEIVDLKCLQIGFIIFTISIFFE